MAGITFSLGEVHVYPDAGEIVLHSPEAGVEQYMERTAHEVLRRARAYAPERTGHLKASGSVTQVGDDWEIEFSAHYALFVEMGHRIVTRSGKTVGFKAPQPYLRPALDEVAGS
jgi:hypothetical protein